MTALLILAIAALTAIATMLGGWLALSWQGRLGPILGFSAGAVIGVAFFDLLPEAMRLATPTALLATGGGFFLYMLFDRLMARHGEAHKGSLGAASFSTHSLLDGLGIGLAFQAGHGAGLVVAAAVLAHDFADGLNTVNVVIRGGGHRAAAQRWLTVDALAPVMGAALSLFIAVPADILGLMLAGFAGFFLYIGAADLLPESLHCEPRLPTTIATLLGALFLFVVARLAI